MYLLVAKQYWQATAITPKILLEYSNPFCFRSLKKNYIVIVNFIESARTVSGFHFLTFFLKSI